MPCYGGERSASECVAEVRRERVSERKGWQGAQISTSLQRVTS